MKIKTETGDLDIIVAAVALPVLIIFALIGIDFIRVPLMKQTITEALTHGVFNLASEWNCESNSYGELTDDFVSCSYRFIDFVDSLPVTFQFPKYGSDPFAPAVYNLCLPLASMTANTSTEEESACSPHITAGGMLVGAAANEYSGIMNNKSADAMVKKASYLTAQRLGGGSGILNPLFLNGEYLVSFGIYQIDVKKDTGYPDKTTPVDGVIAPIASFVYSNPPVPDSTPNPPSGGNAGHGAGGGNLPESVEVMKMSSSIFTLSEIASKAFTRLGWEFVSGVSVDSVGNPVLAPAAGSTGSNSTSLYFQSPRFLVGGVAVRQRGILGPFSFVGGNDPDNPGDFIITDWIIKPLENQFGMEIGGRGGVCLSSSAAPPA